MTRPRGNHHPVTVVATKAVDGAIGFHAEGDEWNHDRGELVFHKDKHGMKKHDYHLVEFMLDDRTGEGLKFPTVPHDAMWVVACKDRANPVCPTKEMTSDYEVMEPICVSSDRSRLIVRNDNPRKEDWSFTLNFVRRAEDEARGDYVSWDPVGSNQNGGN